jgi:hypothetical protein
MKELRELKASLIGFATNIEHEELVQKALGIPDLDLTSLKGGLIENKTSVVPIEKIDLLKNYLIEVDSILGICAIYLKAIL